MKGLRVEGHVEGLDGLGTQFPGNTNQNRLIRVKNINHLLRCNNHDYSEKREVEVLVGDVVGEDNGATKGLGPDHKLGRGEILIVRSFKNGYKFQELSVFYQK